jgi:hypothetical protein
VASRARRDAARVREADVSRHKLNKSSKGGWLLIGPYDERILDTVMAMPSRLRRWEPTLKAWRIADEAKDDAQAIIDACEDEGRAKDGEV